MTDKHADKVRKVMKSFSIVLSEELLEELREIRIDDPTESGIDNEF